MSAIQLNRGNIEQAEQSLALAQEQEAGAAYLGVVKAHLALSRARLDESAMGYRKALENKGLESWQQAECYYGLGKVSLARGEVPQAIEAFDQSLRSDPTWRPIRPKDWLEREGKPREALDLTRKPRGINSGDPINAVLYHKCRETVEARALPTTRPGSTSS